MAALASRVFRLLLAGRDAFEVCVFEEPEPDIRVAGLADHAPDKIIGSGIGRKRARTC
jgi:hypothetical protein